MVTLLRNYLTREGYEIHTAPSGETALQFLELDSRVFLG